MKNIILAMAIAFISVNAMASEVCSQQDGSLIYDSATKFGNSLVVVNPRILIAGQEAHIVGTTRADENSWNAGIGVCKLLGYSQSQVSQQNEGTPLFAMFNAEGQLISFGKNTSGYYTAHTIVCRK